MKIFGCAWGTKALAKSEEKRLLLKFWDPVLYKRYLDAVEAAPRQTLRMAGNSNQAATTKRGSKHHGKRRT